MRNADAVVHTLRQVIIGDHKSWVLFANGTLVIFAEPTEDLAAAAVEIMREFGPVHAGSPAGDFATIDLDAAPGWIVTGHHPDVLTYVAPDEVTEQANTLEVGLAGRAKRDHDGRELDVVHIEARG